MARIKESTPEKRSSLTAEEYWKWRLTIEEMQHAEAKLHNIKLTAQVMERDAEIKKLQRQVFGDKIKIFEEKLADAKKEYESQKEALEKGLGFSLNNCVIDDHTFEVKKLED